MSTSGTPELKDMFIELLLPTASYLNMKAHLTYGVPPGIDPHEVFELGFNTILTFHEKKFPKFYKDGQPLFYPKITAEYQGEELPVVQEARKTTGMEHWIAEINKCTTIEKPDGLESLRTIADCNPKIKEVFNKRLKELQDGME